jgi:hypothetical protein
MESKNGRQRLKSRPPVAACRDVSDAV